MLSCTAIRLTLFQKSTTTVGPARLCLYGLQRTFLPLTPPNHELRRCYAKAHKKKPAKKKTANKATQKPAPVKPQTSPTKPVVPVPTPPASPAPSKKKAAKTKSKVSQKPALVKLQTTPTKPVVPVRTPAASPAPPTGGILAALSNLKERKLLYKKAPGTTIWMCYAVSGLCFGLATYNFYITYWDPIAELPNWVANLYYFVVIVVSAVGFAAAAYPTRIIQRIYALPSKSPSSMLIELQRRPYVPGFPMKRILVENPKKVEVESEIQPVHEATKGTGPVGGEVSGGLFNAMTRPFSVGPGKIMSVARDAVSTERYVGLKVEGVGSYVIHRDGWQWERRGLDRLFGTKRYVGYRK